MHEDDRLVLPRAAELAVYRGHERLAIAQARGLERDEFGARVDDATRKGDRARLPLGRNRDHEARKAERRPPRTEDRRARDRGAHACNQYRHRRAGPDRRGVDRHRPARAGATAGERERREKAKADQHAPPGTVAYGGASPTAALLPGPAPARLVTGAAVGRQGCLEHLI